MYLQEAIDVGYKEHTCCVNAEVQMGAFPAYAHVKYKWEPAQYLNSDTLAKPVFKGSKPGTYSYILTATGTNAGCFGGETVQDTITITVQPPPDPGLPATASGCDSVVLQARAGYPYYDWYLWQNADTAQTFVARSSGRYILTVKDTLGCSARDTVEVTIYPPPLASFTANPAEANLAPDASIQLTDQSSPDVTSWSWSSTKGHTATGELPPPFVFTRAGIYAIKLEVANAGGCTDDTLLHVQILPPVPFEIELPDIFTPNGDGVNDGFYINVQGWHQFELHIYDRWGTRVFSATNPADTWYGRHAQTGVYFYTLQVTGFSGEQVQRAGVVTLLK